MNIHAVFTLPSFYKKFIVLSSLFLGIAMPTMGMQTDVSEIERGAKERQQNHDKNLEGIKKIYPNNFQLMQCYDRDYHALTGLYHHAVLYLENGHQQLFKYVAHAFQRMHSIFTKNEKHALDYPTENEKHALDYPTENEIFTKELEEDKSNINMLYSDALVYQNEENKNIFNILINSFAKFHKQLLSEQEGFRKYSKEKKNKEQIILEKHAPNNQENLHQNRTQYFDLEWVKNDQKSTPPPKNNDGDLIDFGSGH